MRLSNKIGLIRQGWKVLEFIPLIILIFVAVAYSAPKKWNTTEGNQARLIKLLDSKIDNISNLADVKLYLHKLNKALLIEE